MLSSSRDVIAALHDLIETCKDSDEGFRHAAQNMKSREVRALFENYARQADRFAAELETEVQRLGGNPEDHGIHGVFNGLTQPGWVTVTGKQTGEDEAATLTECECGVHALEQSYAAALEKGLPERVRSLVERQHAQVKKVSGRIHDLAGHHPFGVRPRPRARGVA